MTTTSDPDVDNFLNSFEQLHIERQKQTAARMRTLEQQVQVERELYKRSPKKKKIPPIIPPKSKSLSHIVETDADHGNTIFLLKPTARKETNQSSTRKSPKQYKKSTGLEEFETFVKSVHIEKPADMVNSGKGPQVVHYDDVIKQTKRQDLPWNKHDECQNMKKTSTLGGYRNRRNGVYEDSNRMNILSTRENLKKFDPSGNDELQSDPKANTNGERQRGGENGSEVFEVYQLATSKPVLRPGVQPKFEVKTKPKVKPKPEVKPKPKPKPKPKLKPKPKQLVSLKHVTAKEKQNESTVRTDSTEISTHKLHPIPKPALKSTEIPQFLKQLKGLKSPKPMKRPEKEIPEAVTQIEKLRKPKVGPKPKMLIPEAFTKRESLRSQPRTYKSIATNIDIPEALKMAQELQNRQGRMNIKIKNMSELNNKKPMNRSNSISRISANAFTNTSSSEMAPVALPGMVKAQTISSMPEALTRMMNGKTKTRQKNTPRSKTIDNSDLNGGNRKLNHLTKNRARGPKRRLPRNLRAKDGSTTITAVSEKRTPPPIRRPSRNISLGQN